jgi:hypothetical protein
MLNSTICTILSSLGDMSCSRKVCSLSSSTCSRWYWAIRREIPSNLFPSLMWSMERLLLLFPLLTNLSGCVQHMALNNQHHWQTDNKWPLWVTSPYMVNRVTKETNVNVKINLDGTSVANKSLLSSMCFRWYWAIRRGNAIEIFPLLWCDPWKDRYSSPLINWCLYVRSIWLWLFNITNKLTTVRQALSSQFSNQYVKRTAIRC